eukprot:GHVT01022305.1.p1 GENE.GHVT01022305.1~~GHVT01022305.1.p1  ORF type:complete len:316 (+),score=57.46 GHVT01022305.1:107-949(+)
MLETYDRQVIQGPPESARETVLATKALQRGDWPKCSQLISTLAIWEKLVPSKRERVKEMLANRIKHEAMRTYIFAYQSIYDSFSVKQLTNMFCLEPSTVHSIISKMMVKEEIFASWDESSSCLLVRRVDHSRLQVLSQRLAENLCSAVEQNELTYNMKNPKYALTFERRFEGRGGGDRRWYNNDEAGGKGAAGGHSSTGQPTLDKEETTLTAPTPPHMPRLYGQASGQRKGMDENHLQREQGDEGGNKKQEEGGKGGKTMTKRRRVRQFISCMYFVLEVR